MRFLSRVILFALLLFVLGSVNLFAESVSCTTSGVMGFQNGAPYVNSSCLSFGEQIPCSGYYQITPGHDDPYCTTCGYTDPNTGICMRYTRPGAGQCKRNWCTSAYQGGTPCQGKQCGQIIEGGKPVPIFFQSCGDPTASPGTCFINAAAGIAPPCSSSCGSICPVCAKYSPIALSLKGKGWKFTAPVTPFKMSAPESTRMLWSFPDADRGMAWLVTADSPVDNALALIGTGRMRPENIPAELWNGYEWLKTKDANGDGVIDANDPVFSTLLVWVDSNNNGMADPGELATLPLVGILGISTNYQESKFVDQIGNEFRFRSKLILASGSEAEEWSYDVFPVIKVIEK